MAFGRLSPEQANRAIDRIADALSEGTEVASRYARAMLDTALQNAAGRPTPQSEMASRNLTVDGASIRSLAGGAPNEVAAGSEFGSSIYRQFHAPHNLGGYWLYPAADDERTLRAGDQALEEVMQAAIRGFG